jgi:RNA polymerase sigma-70 factor (ECF subfamily)
MSGKTRTARVFFGGQRQLFMPALVFRSTMDTALVIEALNGNSDAFGSLVEKYERPIFNLSFRISGEREDAMDITQTVFMKAFARLESFDPSRNFFSWLYRMTVNEALNFVRRRSRTVQIEADLPSRIPGPDERIIEEESNTLLQRALARLAEDYRVVIILRHFLDLSYREIGDIIGIPEKTVKSRLYTGRHLLSGIILEMS